MKVHLLSILACPGPGNTPDGICGGELKFDSLKEFPREHEEIESGTIKCSACGCTFPIEDSVPRLHAGALADSRVAKTSESFGWEWDRYPGSLPEDRPIFLEEVQLAPEAFAGKTVLDAGCGMGRYTQVALSLDADVVAFDLSGAPLRMIPQARTEGRLHIVQGDLLRPPFKKGVFDVIYSHGVIHHTADTRRAFERLAPLVKRDGLLSVWVYGRPGSWGSFSTNPLKSTRARLKTILPLIWIIVWVRMILSDLLRVFTTRLPVPLLYLLCYPLTLLGMLPLIKYLTFSVHPDFQVRLIENFDWLAPPFQSKHTKEELRQWYKAAGFEVLRHQPHGVIPKVGILGKKLTG